MRRVNLSPGESVVQGNDKKKKTFEKIAIRNVHKCSTVHFYNLFSKLDNSGTYIVQDVCMKADGVSRWI